MSGRPLERVWKLSMALLSIEDLKATSNYVMLSTNLTLPEVYRPDHYADSLDMILLTSA